MAKCERCGREDPRGLMAYDFGDMLCKKCYKMQQLSDERDYEDEPEDESEEEL